MRVKEYIKLKNKFDDKSFENAYGSLDKMLHYSSILGNVASIFFAFFFLNQLLFRATSDFSGRVLIIGTTSIIFLTGFELLKRFVLRNLSYAAIQVKKLNTEVIYNLVFSLVLLTSSFYLSLSGAKVFADKRELIEQTRTVEISTQVDSLNLIFDKNLKYKITERDGLIKNRNLYSKKIADATYTSRLKEYNSLIKQANEEIKRADDEIARMRTEKETTVATIKNEITTSSKLKVNEIFKNQIAFILISSFIELLILVGILFHSFFTIKIYNEFEYKADNIHKYQVYKNYKALLALMYQQGSSLNTGIAINDDTRLKSLISLSNFGVGHRKKYGDDAIKKFINVCNSLKIFIIDSDNKFVISVTYKEAKKTLLEHFN